MSRTIAVVGSGPGGMYAVQGLLDKTPDCRVDVIERLPSPFGLIRGGVAPDHQKTKRVSKAYERTLSDERVRYLGNVEVGRIADDVDELSGEGGLSCLQGVSGDCGRRSETDGRAEREKEAQRAVDKKPDHGMSAIHASSRT